MSNNVVEAIDNISKKLGGNHKSSNNATEAIDNVKVNLVDRFNNASYDLTWAQIVNDIQAGDFSRYAVGDTISCSYGEYDNPLLIVDIREEELEDGTTRKGMWLQQKYATADAIQFSHPRALFACPEGLAAGTYHIICGYKVNNYFTKDSGIQFTLTEDIPEGGRIALDTGTGTVLYVTIDENLKANVYASDGKTVLETVAVTKGTEGTLLGTTAANANDRSGDINGIYEAQYGCNNYQISAVRQWLNSDKPAGEWWQPQDKWDIAPVNLNDVPGYLSLLPKSLVTTLRPVKTVTVGNTAIYSNAELETYDLATIPSKEQIYATKQSNGEGAAFTYWQELNGTASTFIDNMIYDALKIGRVNAPTIPNTIFLRSASVGIPTNVWNVVALGIVVTAYACYQLRLQPTFFIG